MKIFSPFAKHENHPYLQELLPYSQNLILQRDFKEFDDTFDLIHIHWPEAIFNWDEPTKRGLIALKKEIGKWKEKTRIIYTKHDYKRTKGNTPAFAELFKLIEESTDVFIHLGEYSRSLYQQKFPRAKHELVKHHLFETSFPKISKIKAREELGIDENALVLIAPGNIRKPEERKLVLKAFDSLKVDNKVLISTNMKLPTVVFKGRVRLKPLFNVQKYLEDNFKEKYRPPDFLFTYCPLSKRELGLRMSAADIVLVPRIDLLNSGIVYLALSFGKITLGPAAGNIEEELRLQGLPVFNPHSWTSVEKAVDEALKIFRINKYRPKNNSKLAPRIVAEELDEIYKKYAI